MRKLNKGELAKQAESKVYQEFNSKISSARNILNKMADTLKKPVKSMFRSRPNDGVKNGNKHSNEEGRKYVRDQQMLDYLDKD